MLELRNITYEVEDNQDNKEILKDVSLTIDEHFVAITGPRILQNLILPSVQNMASAMHFSSRYILKD